MASSGEQPKFVSHAKSVDPQEMVKLNWGTHHKSCFKCCYVEGCTSISPSACAMFWGLLDCSRHLDEAAEKGDFKTAGQYRMYDWSRVALSSAWSLCSRAKRPWERKRGNFVVQLQ